MKESDATAAPTEQLCPLCQMMPMEAGRPMCPTCWRLAPTWVRRKFKDNQQADWSRLLEEDSIRTPKQEENDGD